MNRAAEQERLRQEQILQEIEEILAFLTFMELFCIPVIVETEDQYMTRINKGRRFTVLGSKTGNGDNSYKGDIFEVVECCGPLIVAKRICNNDGRPLDSYQSKMVTLSMEQYRTKPVTDSHVRALQNGAL